MVLLVCPWDHVAWVFAAFLMTGDLYCCAMGFRKLMLSAMGVGHWKVQTDVMSRGRVHRRGNKQTKYKATERSKELIKGMIKEAVSPGK